MSRAFEERYAVPYIDVANGIDRDEWPERTLPARENIVIRYAGGLSPYMGLETLLSLAWSIDVLRARTIICSSK